jgi:hypothetical protein
MDNRTVKFALIFAGMVIFSACAKQNNPPSKVEDPNPGNERIYGDIDGPPRQAANEYPDDPTSIQRADEIRKKLFEE